MPSLNLRLAAVAAAFAAVFLSTHTFTRAQLVRVRLVDAPRPAPGNAPPITIDTSTDTRLLAPPFAVVAAVDAPEPATVTVSVDGHAVCERAVRPGSRQRLDCAATGDWNPAAAHDVSVRSTSDRVMLQSLELATHHGHTSGAHYALVLPKGSKTFTRPGLVEILLACLAVAGVMALPWPPPMPRTLRWIHRVVSGTILLLLAAVLLSDRVSPYVVVVSMGTLARWSLLLFLPWLYRAAAWLLAPPSADECARRGWRRPLTVAAVVVAAFTAVAASRANEYFDGNASGLLSIARSAFDRNPLMAGRNDVRQAIVLQESGYDGQFMYFAMFDPFVRQFRANPVEYRRVMDAPPYRFGRIGFPLLALIASAGDWTHFPAAMMALVLGGAAVFALLLARMAQEAGLPPAIGGLTLLVPGFWQSAQSSLPEPIAAALLLGGVLCLSHRRWGPAAALFAASLLTRETGIVAIACVVGVHMLRERRAVWPLVVAAAVVLAWRGYVAWTLYPDWGIQGLLFHPPDLTAPFAGIADLWREVAQGRYYPGVPGMQRAAVALPLLLTAGWLLAVVLAIAVPHPWHAAAAVYGLVAVSLNLPQIWNHVGNAQRGTFELFVMLAWSAVLLPRYPRPLRTATKAFWAFAFVYVLLLGFDSDYIRSVLLPL